MSAIIRSAHDRRLIDDWIAMQPYDSKPPQGTHLVDWSRHAGARERVRWMASYAAYKAGKSRLIRHGAHD